MAAASSLEAGLEGRLVRIRKRMEDVAPDLPCLKWTKIDGGVERRLPLERYRSCGRPGRPNSVTPRRRRTRPLSRRALQLTRIFEGRVQTEWVVQTWLRPGIILDRVSAAATSATS